MKMIRKSNQVTIVWNPRTLRSVFRTADFSTRPDCHIPEKCLQYQILPLRLWVLPFSIYNPMFSSREKCLYSDEATRPFKKTSHCNNYC